MIILFFGEGLEAIVLGVLLVIYIIFFNDKKEYHGLYKGSIIELITLIILKLIDFWTSIPFWLYLFVGGIIIISVVTKKELNKDNDVVIKNIPNNMNNNVDVTMNNNVIQNNTQNNFCRYCGEELYGKKEFCANCGKKVL